MTGKPERIGVLGGTFDPIHNAHLFVAVAARDALDLDRVLVVVAGEPWQKTHRHTVTPGQDRLAVVRAALEGVDRVEASSIEVDREGPSFMADTLAELHGASPGAELFLILGADAAAGLPTWARPDEVCAAATVVVVDRSPMRRDALPEPWRHVSLQIPRLDISSSDVRDRLAKGLGVDGLVPPQAIREIRRRGLYPDHG